MRRAAARSSSRATSRARCSSSTAREAEERALLAAVGPLKTLRSGPRLFVFAAEAAPLVEQLRKLQGGDKRPFVARPANLEDLFLATTGTKLEEARMSFSVSLPHALAVCRRNASMYRRTWKLNILPNFFEPVFYLWSIGLGVGAYVSNMGGMRYVAVPRARPRLRRGDERRELRDHVQRLRPPACTRRCTRRC